MKTLLILILGLVPLLSKAQLTLEGSAPDTSAINPDLKDVFSNDEGQVAYYVVKGKRGQTTSLHLNLGNNQARQLYIVVDKKEEVRNILVIENKFESYEIELVPKKQKAKSLKGTFIN